MFIVMAVLSVWVSTATAGPGGGTYYANSPSGGTTGTALRKFVDSLPGVGAANANNLGQYIPVATKMTDPSGHGDDYYEIGLVEYTKKMHSDLPKATRLRGYVDLNPALGTRATAASRAQYLGPLIIASQNKPVRVKFTNLLPTGAAGNLFIPVDTSLMGAGRGPVVTTAKNGSVPAFTNFSGMFTQNRGTLHLHGGNTPWISDGTPHQWTVPVGENSTPYQKGLSTQDVPDMPATGQGEMTFYYTNQQSNRLMFYHDHSYGITRLNVYAGEAAGYLLTDPTEDNLINSGVLPNLGGNYRYGIPLVIQDRTFVPQNIAVQDSKWDTTKWGQYGDLWFPHVYEPNQDPNSPGGANPFGRWDYGPWFWPPVIVDAAHAKIPEPSTTPEAFMDTPIVNGTAYPYLVVQPKAYRFRILNACNDRTLNLSLFYADPGDPTGKEVKMVPAGPNPTFPPTWPTDGRDGGVPDPLTAGPSWYQIGSEGGFLPNVAVVPPQPIGYDYNRRNIVVLNTLNRGLMLGPAERADVVVDFSSVPTGSKIILYNDGPAPNPAFDPRYDYYTGDVDQTTSGGAPSTLRGYGPNTRTVMQFQVNGTPGPAFNLAALQSALPAAFKASQPVPIVPETVFNAAYGTTYTNDILAKIQDYSVTLTPIPTAANPAPLQTTIPFRPKAIQELWDAWGRMNATLGVELPFTNNTVQTTVPLGYADLATEYTNDGQETMWKITHNGVDTHPVHFHHFDVQLINRVGWDGAIRLPDDNEYGWKETVRMNPLEDVVVAFRPQKQTLPFALPHSVRPLDPSSTVNSTINIVVDPYTQGAGLPVATPNTMFDFGFEYVWHCHILGHEENDFMRPVIFNVPTAVPAAPTALTVTPGSPGVNQVTLAWTDNAADTSSYRIERAPVTGGGAGTVGTYVALGTTSFLVTSTPSYVDSTVASNTRYRYRVIAYNSVGDSTPLVSSTITTNGFTNPTGLTITPDKPTPHVVGTQVTFTATGSGASATAVYSYRFWLTTGTTKTLVQDWSLKNQWQLMDTTPVGNYTLTVDVRTSPTAAPFTSTLAYVVVPPATPPATVSTPVPGVYAAAPVTVTLTASTIAPPATIYYTTDGTIPTTASTKYTVPIVLNVTTTVNYFAVDVNGNQEAVHSDTWVVHTPDAAASVAINNGALLTNSPAVNLTINAVDPVGIATMSFSNDGTVWTPEEIFPSNPAVKSWLLTAGDGVKTVYVRLRDKSLGGGYLYAPITATITVDTVPPVTTPSPAPGTYGPTQVAFTTSKPATVYYTVDGTTPQIPSPTSTSTTTYVYTTPILVATTTTINYFAVDLAGNAEAVKTGTWTIPPADLVASVKVNNGAAQVNSTAVTLNLAATDPNPVTTMQFSNDGTTYTAEETYATTKAWTLAAGDGPKTVYVKFRDSIGVLYAPVSANVILDTVAPVTTPSPIPGIYGVAPGTVTLTASEPATIYYTVDGTVPTTASTVYTGPVPVSATTTIKYFAVDLAGNAEAVKTAAYTVNGADLVASVAINNGAARTNNTMVNLTLAASDPAGIATMQFSNDGVTFSAEEPYSTSKIWQIPVGDGPKTVYVRFRDLALPTGVLYPPVTATIVLDTVAPVSTASPIPATYAQAPVNVTLTANEPATIYYTIDGTPPTTTSAIYSAPLTLTTDTTVKYFAVDVAGNAEPVNTGTWKFHIPDMIASVSINNGALQTKNAAVALTLSATDPNGVVGMQFSNDGITYSAEEPYASGKAWTLTPGDGKKTVYVKFRDGTAGGGALYTFTASITLDTTPPLTVANPVPGTYVPIAVTLTTSEPATTYYTLDGTTPTTASLVYTAPIQINSTTTISYFSVDLAGNAETVKSGTWNIPASDLTASVAINGGQLYLNKNVPVTLTLAASDPFGIATMQFSNDGVNFTAEENYATTKQWTLTPGDGLKTVYVKFRDGTAGGGTLYAPITASITVDTVAPATSASPVPGIYASSPGTVTLTANEKGATIHYTTDGSIPTINSPVYTAPIPVNATTTIQYFAVDLAGNVETVKSGTWTLSNQNLVASITINGGTALTNSTAVTLALAASDPSGATIATMQFSNDGANFTAEEPYATTKNWTLPAGDGPKTVYVRFRNNALPAGKLFSPLSATITLDTIAPVVSSTPAPGTYAAAPVPVTLTANEAAKIYYTVDGSTPTTASAMYTAPISVAATTTIKYFAVDLAGNVEAPQSGTWTIHASADLTASIQINHGALRTNSTAVLLNLSAVDPVGVATMQFSNDGVTYSAEEPFPAGATIATKSWILSAGDGAKTVYVRFRDATLGGGVLYPPITAGIILDTAVPVTAASPVPGVYAAPPVQVTLTVNKPATIYYTLDGTTPTSASLVYSAPIPVTSVSTINYLAIDAAGNVETAKHGTWTVHTNDMTASVQINGGAARTTQAGVTLNLSATDPTGLAAMQFSNDGVNYSAEEPFATTKNWILASGEGLKTVYVRFRDNSLGGGVLYTPITANIIVDTIPPTVAVTPLPAIYTSAPVSVTLSASEAATIYYTIDGSTPTTASAVYTGPLSLSATTTVSYLAVDLAGNSSPVTSNTWTIDQGDLLASVTINNGAAVTNNLAVTLDLTANDPAGIASMQFSNDGVSFSAEEPYATTKAWTLAAGDGIKQVYARFRDKALPTGTVHAPVTASITLDQTAPVTTALPVAGTYATGPVQVTLVANEGANIYYTVDGTTPTTASSVYQGPISVSTSNTISYFAVDAAGNVESVKTGTWTVHSQDLSASVVINTGAPRINNPQVSLSLKASDPVGIVAMQFSNDGAVYTAEEPYAATKVWTLTPGDGPKTVYVRFRDASIGGGTLYDPVTASVVVDTVTPITTASPVPGEYASGPVAVTLTANEAGTIYYTTDGTTPTQASAVYTGPISVTANTTIQYFSVDQAGNVEGVKSGTWTLHTADMVMSVKINNGATTTASNVVTLTLAATDPQGVSTMQFSSDGVNYSTEEPYATTKQWTLSPGEGPKTIYVRFRDATLGGGHLYFPVTASITYGAKDGLLPGTTSYLQSALRALQIAKGQVTPGPLDLAHADVAPSVNGVPQPDGQIDLLDVYVLLRRAVGLFPL
ncbi:chitobiase/beta-hexosaminidase C-terminal domain-containing protein [Geomesophilobacter sediminis]|nr:chitobiase/beta-hexosaminidase C-terminal domain-containing protein [Geomesophilobacter sediminis]